MGGGRWGKLKGDGGEISKGRWRNFEGTVGKFRGDDGVNLEETVE